MPRERGNKVIENTKFVAEAAGFGCFYLGLYSAAVLGIGTAVTGVGLMVLDIGYNYIHANSSLFDAGTAASAGLAAIGAAVSGVAIAILKRNSGRPMTTDDYEPPSPSY